MENIKDLRPLCVLTIASSDSGGGAGIQADLKTFAAHGHFGLSAVSGITAQNTLEVLDAEYVTPRLLTAELRAVFADFEVSAIKIGLLGTAENTLAVYYFLKKFEERKVPVVVDPVMCSSTGHVFLQDDAVFALKTLLKMAYLVTPNLFEARALSGEKVAGFEDYHSAARKIMELGAQNVLIKGGHLTESDSSDDFLLKSDGSTAIFKGRRIDSKNDHGTGCTLSSAIASRLAEGKSLDEAVGLAKSYLQEAMLHAPSLGHGRGPLNHLFAILKA